MITRCWDDALSERGRVIHRSGIVQSLCVFPPCRLFRAFSRCRKAFTLGRPVTHPSQSTRRVGHPLLWRCRQKIRSPGPGGHRNRCTLEASVRRRTCRAPILASPSSWRCETRFSPASPSDGPCIGTCATAPRSRFQPSSGASDAARATEPSSRPIPTCPSKGRARGCSSWFRS